MKKGLYVALIMGISFSALAAKNNQSSPRNYNELVKELEGVKDAKNDLQFYSEIISDYQAGKSKTLNLRLNSFVKKFPKSPYLDNSIYLAGKLALEEKNYPEALQHFQRIITQYPLSNKVISAKFGKAMAYKKMNLNPQAKEVFTDIRKKYPNSPEYFRAETEMKLIK
ncbi:MAG: tetratricopeptide repeat protein [Bdellovibrionaceae bacterium]|nr:tetratricopeptide repeat protein [Pseudobdellovibrionaceae bacterium]NUM57895.1 tetratricopeptide repeat protein [Pseudobdellovibrionaceae bacterium]